MTTRRLGMTLIKTLVAIGIGGLLLLVLIPAVQKARESARRATCQNHLRQLVVAIHNHESAHASPPSLYNGTFLEHPQLKMFAHQLIAEF